MCIILFSRANFVADSILNHTDIIRFMKRFPFPFGTYGVPAVTSSALLCISDGM